MRENEKIEFKKSTSQLREGVISLCAMLNKHGHGLVYFGIKDDGSICGQVIGKKTTADISHEIRNNLKPLPEVTISVESMEEKDVICVSAKGEDTPYSAYGRYYTRVDDADILMDSGQLLRFFESKEKTYSRWEEALTPYGIDMVDEELLIQYIRDANETGRLNYVYRNISDCLVRLNLMNDEGLLNNAGYYLFGNDGPIVLKEVVYPTDDRREFTDLKQFRGNIFQCINEGMRYIQNNIHYGAEIEGIKRVETPEIPVKALREIVVNSFAHCRYQKGDYNEITITRSKVKIYNPGGIVNDTDPIDFASGRVGSKIRNPLIATVLFKNGYIDAFGTGFDRTFKVCAENAVEYEYSSDEYGFAFSFMRKNGISGKINDKINGKINDVNRRIIEALADDCYLTIPALAEIVGKSETTVYRHISEMTSEEILERVGSRKSGYWKVNI